MIEQKSVGPEPLRSSGTRRWETDVRTCRQVLVRTRRSVLELCELLEVLVSSALPVVLTQHGSLQVLVPVSQSAELTPHRLSPGWISPKLFVNQSVPFCKEWELIP